MKKCFSAISAGALILLTGVPLTGRAAETMEVPYGHASVIHLGVVPAQIVVGNPSVADITVQSSKTLAVFGKNPGGTSLSALDARGNVLWEKTVVVTSSDEDGVTVHYGTGKNWHPGGETVVATCTAQRCSNAMPLPASISGDAAAKTAAK